MNIVDKQPYNKLIQIISIKKYNLRNDPEKFRGRFFFTSNKVRTCRNLLCTFQNYNQC